jgi:hypothetical protein
MNDEDFESLLRQQPPSKAPSQWRAEILAAANTAAATEIRQAVDPEPKMSLLAICLQLMRLNPAWSGIVGLWLVSALLRLSTPQLEEHGPVLSAATKPIALQAVLMVWRDQFREKPAATDQQPQTSKGSEPAAADRPRSHRRSKTLMA